MNNAVEQIQLYKSNLQRSTQAISCTLVHFIYSPRRLWVFASSKLLAMGSVEPLPYWQINVAPQLRTDSPPPFLENLSAKDKRIISTPEYVLDEIWSVRLTFFPAQSIEYLLGQKFRNWYYQIGLMLFKDSHLIWGGIWSSTITSSSSMAVSWNLLSTSAWPGRNQSRW